jgi:hypothetical protein
MLWRAAALDIAAAEIRARVKHGDLGAFRANATPEDVAALEKLYNAESKAMDNFLAALDKITRWDFRVGVAWRYLRDRLTIEQARSIQPPTLPPEASSRALVAFQVKPKIKA